MRRITAFAASLVVGLLLAASAATAAKYAFEGYIQKKMENKVWIAVVEGTRYFIEVSGCLPLPLQLDEFIILSTGDRPSRGDELRIESEKCIIRTIERLK